MFAFTKQEQFVVILFILVILIGSILHYAFKKYPSLHDMVNLIDSDKVYSKTNINTASFEELINIPYIGEYTADNIIRYRQEHGLFESRQQLKAVKGIRHKNYKKFLPYLKPIQKK